MQDRTRNMLIMAICLLLAVIFVVWITEGLKAEEPYPSFPIETFELLPEDVSIFEELTQEPNGLLQDAEPDTWVNVTTY